MGGGNRKTMKKKFSLIIILLLVAILNPITVNAQETAKDTLIKTVTTTNDGLYKDEYEEGRYIYRGVNPNNYITFNNETAGWRILSVEKDGTIKIIKTNSIGEMLFNEREIERGTYCKSWTWAGCNAWAKMDYFSIETAKGTVDGTVTKDSDINTYLNTIYYEGLTNEAKEIIIDYNFNIGGTKEDYELNIYQLMQDEKKYTWEGKIGLINFTDFIKTMNDNQNTWIKEGYTITPCVYNQETAEVNISKLKSNKVIVAYADESHDIYPVVNLDPYIMLSGEGTVDNPYTITAPVKIKLETFGDLEKELIFRLETTGKTLNEIKEEINDQIGTEVEQDGKVCTLDSWYLDKDLKTKFDEETPINNNLTLFGRWECRETVNVPNTLLQIPRSIITLGCGLIILGIGIIIFIIRKKKKMNGEIK